MSLLRSAFEQRQITAPWQGFLVGPSRGDGKTKAGVPVNLETSLGVSAAWSCVTLLADVVSSLPVVNYRRTKDGRERMEVPAQIVVRPSRIFTRREWLFQSIVCGAFWGNVYGQVLDRDDSSAARVGIPATVELATPNVIRVDQRGQMTLPEYYINGSRVPFDDMMHLRRYPQVGSVEGMAPLNLHRDLLGVAVAAQEYAARWFGDDAHPASLLINEGEINEEQAKEAKRRWVAAGRSREPRTLGNGWKYHQIQASPADSELADTWTRIGTSVAQVFRVPPEMIGVATSGSSVTYANREQRSIDFLTYTVEPWLSMFEDWWDQVLPDAEFAKFNPDALLRVDTLTRYRVHDVAIRMGKNSINEIRRLEDEDPIDGGDEYLWPPYRAFPVPSDE